MDYPRRREMTGVYIPINREISPNHSADLSIDITDLTEEELREHCFNETHASLTNLVVTLKNVINKLGDKYGVPYSKTREELKREAFDDPTD